MPRPLITLTTDFCPGPLVASVKGVALGINPDAVLVDVSHQVPPRDIAHGAFVLGAAYRYFPPDTIHVAVVDPGVGTSRRAMLLVTPVGRFLAPDNGLLTYVLNDQYGPGATRPRIAAGFMDAAPVPVPPGCTAYSLTNERFWRHPVSNTFHGRDIFAPVAAHLSLGTSPEELGRPVDSVQSLAVGPPRMASGVISGRVVYVDGFGNLVTNIAASDLPEEHVEVEIAGRRIGGLSRTYADAGGLLALVGSHGYLEIAEAAGDAAAQLGAAVGTDVNVAASRRAARDP